MESERRLRRSRFNVQRSTKTTRTETIEFLNDRLSREPKEFHERI
jgi:hypothetical protein